MRQEKRERFVVYKPEDSSRVASRSHSPGGVSTIFLKRDESGHLRTEIQSLKLDVSDKGRSIAIADTSPAQSNLRFCNFGLPGMADSVRLSSLFLRPFSLSQVCCCLPGEGRTKNCPCGGNQNVPLEFLTDLS